MSESKVKRLRCNYLKNPMGTSLKAPRFSWQMDTKRKGASQTAYQLQVAMDAGFETVIWDTDWVKCDKSIQVVYGGPALKSMTPYFWRVRILDEMSESSEWSETADWETGLKKSDWQAKWIEPEDTVDPKAFKPAPYLRKEFSTKSALVSARLYITSHGLYEAYLNGQRVGDQVFMPGNTSYTHRVQYQAYDVTNLLEEGANCMGVTLGDGWYRGSINANSSRNSHGTKVALLSQILLTYADGSTELVCSDESWKTSTGPIVRSDMKEGEVYDARKELTGWNETGFNDAGWKFVYLTDIGYETVIASEGSPIRKMECFKPVELIHTPKGQVVLDFGQNLAGYTTMKVIGPAGTIVKIQHSETLDENGNFSLAYLNSAGGMMDFTGQQNTYILKGADEEYYEPHFTVMGFRFACIEGYPGVVDPADFTAYAIYSDMGRNGQFESSNQKLNQLHENVVWSQKGNFLDIPTDCPTRERAGWTGDSQIFVHAGSLLMHDAAFFTKWIKDVAAQQNPDGLIRNFVPAPPPGMGDGRIEGIMNMLEGSSGWGDAIVIVPWTIYQMFGDTTILKDVYENMKKWIEFERFRASKTNWSKKINPAYWFNRKRKAYQKYIWDTKYQWGEWLEPDMPINASAFDMLKKVVFSDPVVATAYFEHSARLLSQIAAILGKDEDAKEYEELADKIKDAYIQEFIQPDGTIKVYSNKQAPYLRVLTFGLYTQELHPKLEQKLIERVESTGRHLGTGFLSTPFLCDMLSKLGRTDIAYDVLLQEDLPSWLYAVNHGATTIWEDWDGVKEDGSASASLNHYSKGAVVSWLYEYVCGIQLDSESLAYHHFYLKPEPGGGLTYARAKFTSMYGEIQSDWQKVGDGIKYSFQIPANSTATVVLRGRADFSDQEGVTHFQQMNDAVQFDLVSGSYEFMI